MPSTCDAETAPQECTQQGLAAEHTPGRGEERVSPVCCNFCGHLRLMQKVSCGGEQICGRSILKDCSLRG